MSYRKFRSTFLMISRFALLWLIVIPLGGCDVLDDVASDRDEKSDLALLEERLEAAEERLLEETRAREELQAQTESREEIHRQSLEDSGQQLVAVEQRLAEREAQLRQQREILDRQDELAARLELLESRERELFEREREVEAREVNLAVAEDELRQREEAQRERQPAAHRSGRPAWVPEADSDRHLESSPSSASVLNPSGVVSASPRVVASTSLQPGRVVEVEILERLSSQTHDVGDVFRGRLVQPLTSEDGTLIVPAGAAVEGVVTEVTPLRRVGGQASISIEFIRIAVSPGEELAIRASLSERGIDRRKERRKIVGATVAGAILGRVLGGKGGDNAILGAAVGAAAGTAVAARTKGKDAVIPAGEIVALQLDEVVSVQVEMTGTVD